MLVQTLHYIIEDYNENAQLNKSSKMKHNDKLPQLLCELMFLGTIKLNKVGSKKVSNFLGCVISSKFHADI